MRRGALGLCLVALWTAAAAADEPKANPDLAAATLALRTALHHDPLLESPLEQLLAPYRAANRVEELLALYRTHLAKFPQDAGAATVLVRLLAATDDAAAADKARIAVERFPHCAGLHYAYYTILRKQRDAKAADQLDRAIELETQPAQAGLDRASPAACRGGRPR